MKLKSILATALAAVVAFSSCSKDENGTDNNVVDNGKAATMDLAISFPTLTRAADANANADEVKVKDITVFIFKTDGSLAPINGAVPAAAPTFDPATDFDVDVATNTYTMKEASRITTTAGAKLIYVGINLPASLKAKDSKAALEAEWESAMADLVTTDGMAMISQEKAATLNAQEVPTDPTVSTNKVSVTVERMVSKVAVRNQATPSTGAFAQGFTIAPDQFSVGNRASHMFPIQQVDGAGKLLTPMNNLTAVELPLKALNANAAPNNSVDAFYVPEHRPKSNLRGEATYAVVRGKLNVTGWAYVDGSDVLKTDGTATLTAGQEVYLVKDATNSYFCKDISTAGDVKNKLGNTANVYKYIVASDSNIYCFYYIFLNNKSTLGINQLAVYRNQFFNIKVGDINGVGYPGDPANPDQPTPVIPDPEEPIIETDAYLEVEVDVKAWEMVDTTTDLE